MCSNGGLAPAENAVAGHHGCVSIKRLTHTLSLTLSLLLLLFLSPSMLPPHPKSVSQSSLSVYPSSSPSLFTPLLPFLSTSPLPIAPPSTTQAYTSSCNI